ncbi:transglycosylase domain-containing protein [Citricoccus nitrophenolicus]|uniref:Transglycosylase domain-containing protein n=1 Tax=Citricoccus nitrophenolicus TaxID=863575 RepID=A0ABV0IKB8_9MICC|nr:transglycosylase domain-containing protein [Citricoccus sp. I39-566]NUL47468.1 penicillin-binding protein [Cellulosimicrobium funkei]WMY78318.1 transglycosylase domain-containing protein [Citricoccus sp. I39-566]
MANRKSPFFDTATTLGKIVAFLGISALCGVLAAGLLLPMAAVGGATATAGGDMLDQLPAELKEEPLSVPSRVLDKDGAVLATFYAENRVPVSLDEISQNMQDAIISIEDERFYEHSGVDARGLTRALVNNATSDSTQGASTITQQYVNNVLINAQYLNNERTTISGTKSVADKLREMKLAVAVEKEMTKDEILEGYLNIVLFSGRVYGVEAASRYFFDKSAAELNVPESALLAGMVQSPNGYNPVNNPEGATARRNVVLGAMLGNDVITQAEYDEAVQAPLPQETNPLPSGCMAAETANYFCDYVRRVVEGSEAFGPDVESRQRLLDRGGLEITTTLDSDLQNQAEQTAKANAPYTTFENSSGLEGELGASLVTVEPGTGNVRAMAQNTNYDPGDTEGGTTINFNVDQPMGGGQGFQMGSTVKPFVFLSFIESGYSMTDTLDASINNYPTYSNFRGSCAEGGYFPVRDEDGWDVRNAIADMHKPMRADYGLYWSINTATVAAAYAQDLCAITDVTDRVGIHNAGTGEPINPAQQAFLLGSEYVSPLTMAAAYATLADDGNYCEPRVITEVTDSRGNSYQVPPVNCEKVADTQQVAELNNTLKAIASERIAEDISFPIAGKTGTNNASSSTWFIGSTTGLTTASWVGNYRNLVSLEGHRIGGVLYEDVWGSIIAGPMWADYMSQAAPQYDTADFTAYDGPASDPRTMGSREGGERVTVEGRPGPQPFHDPSVAVSTED